MLEALFPGRLDLGIGRAPGSDQLTAAALAYPGWPRDVCSFPEQVRDVLAYLTDAVSQLYQTTDIGIVTICYDFADRLRSYELVAEVCELKRQGGAA